MAESSFFIKSADPPATDIVIAISPEHLMHLVDQLCCVLPVVFIVCSPEQLEKVADCKCIGPKISLMIPRGRTQAGSPCEFRHQSSRLGRCTVRDHFAITNRMRAASGASRRLKNESDID